MKKLLTRAGLVFGALLVLVALRVWLLPAPVKEDWAVCGLARRYYAAPAGTGLIDPGQVAHTEYYRGFFRPGRRFDQGQSRVILAVLQDSAHFRGDTTPDFTQMLIYYDAAGRVLGYTDLDLFDDALAVAATEPGGFRCGSVMTRQGRQRLLRALGYAAPFTPVSLRQQRQ